MTVVVLAIIICTVLTAVAVVVIVRVVGWPVIVVGGGYGHGHVIGPSPENPSKNVSMRQKKIIPPNLGYQRTQQTALGALQTY